MSQDNTQSEPAQQEAPQTPVPDITFFAQTNFRSENRRFGIKRDDRRRHMYVIGKTGMGKSTLLENMIIQDIQNGEGVAVVDPHGDLVEKVVQYIPSHRINDVVYFNPSDAENPIAFNILENVSPEYKHLVSNGLVGVFKKIWADSWGPRLEYILTHTILALLEYPGSTLLGVTRMLVDARYRKKIVRNITDPVVKSFWTNEYNNYTEKFRNEAIAPIQNKVGQFLSSSLIRNIVGQTKSTIDMREIMDSKKILLMNLAKGRIGEENAALLGAMMITKMQLAAMSRVDIPEHERKDFFLYVDEFQNFSTESFANILSEARKYRLSLIMAHQYIEQLSDEVRAAVFGNVGTMVAFRVGATDAEEFEKEFQPVFLAEDMVTLPAHHVYLRLMIDGVTSEPFSATTLPPISGATDNREKVIHVSRERYARSRGVVEEKIRKWAGMVIGSAESVEGDEDEEGPGFESTPDKNTLIERPAQPQQNEKTLVAPEAMSASIEKTGVNLLSQDSVRVVERSVQKEPSVISDPIPVPARPAAGSTPAQSSDAAPVAAAAPKKAFDSLLDALQSLPRMEDFVPKQHQNEQKQKHRRLTSGQQPQQATVTPKPPVQERQVSAAAAGRPTPRPQSSQEAQPQQPQPQQAQTGKRKRHRKRKRKQNQTVTQPQPLHKPVQPPSQPKPVQKPAQTQPLQPGQSIRF